MKKNIVTFIEITESHIKFFQAQKFGSEYKLAACDIHAMESFRDEEIIRILSQNKYLKNIPKNSLSVIIPRKLSILKQIRLPSLNDHEIKKMVGLQLVNQIPYGLEDVVYDYWILDKDKEGYSNLAVVIVHKDVCHRYLNLLNSVGISAGSMTVSSLGITGWLNHIQRNKNSNIQYPCIFIDIDARFTEICFCLNDRLLFSRSINCGAEDIGADGFSNLNHQVDLSIKMYRKEHMGPPIKKIYGMITLGNGSGLEGALEEKFSIPAQLWSNYEEFPV